MSGTAIPGKMGESGSDVSSALREASLRVLLGGPRQLQSEELDPGSQGF